MKGIAVITGASAGVGRATARELAARGWGLALLARGHDGLVAAQREAWALGVPAIAIPTDVADEAAVEAAADLTERELGPIDVWINNAMNTVVSPIDQLMPDEVRRVTEVTYLGAVWGTMAALRRMKPRDRGHIIQVGSALAYRAIPLQAAYCGAKHAMRGFTDSLRSELLHDGSRVALTMIHLPAMNTPQFSWCRTRFDKHPQPVPPIYQPEVAARVIADSIGYRRREVFVGKPTVKAILGSKLLPGYADHVLAREGYDGQMADMPLHQPRRDNLFEPLPGDFGAHGVFTDRATNDSPYSRLSVLWTHVRNAVERALAPRRGPFALPSGSKE
ncbi:SDR family oxidoreductase [Sandaracinus amylolyticus]|uniref:3-oxoacyl-[acyl-carrier protein] reductase n=1 Tax=Sandaracinus amylolyticus TaxID=927083 RepID=A0A0F6W7U5_9BACT|nr:SDR family oxidoreductase [Sandaracinus amylolyticus]AKF09636.1 3-oxoacyl-[acyl-carrier protein] reductase [Sandaracinus amylolyticus]